MTSELETTKEHARNRDAENQELKGRLRTAASKAQLRQVSSRHLQAQSEQFSADVQRLRMELRQVKQENRRLKRQRDEIEEMNRKNTAHHRKQLVHARRERDLAQQQQRRKRHANIGQSSEALQVQLSKTRDRLNKKDVDLSSRLAHIQRLYEKIHLLEGRVNDVDRRASVANRVDANMLMEYSEIEGEFDQVIGQIDEQAALIHSQGLLTQEDRDENSLEKIEELTLQLKQAREENKELENEIQMLKRQLAMSADERVEQLQQEILVLSKRSEKDEKQSEEGEMEADHLSENISAILDKKEPLTQEDIDQLRQHLILLRQRFGKLIEVERDQAVEKFREAKLELERENAEKPEFDEDVRRVLAKAGDYKDHAQELNAFRINVETDAENDPHSVDHDVLEERRILCQELRDDAEEQFQQMDDMMNDAQLRHEKAKMLNLQIQQSIHTLAIAGGNDEVVHELEVLATETQALERSSEDTVLKCREARMMLVHSSMNAADTENALLQVQVQQGGSMDENQIFDIVMAKRLESMNIVSEEPAVHLAGLTEYDPPELIREAIDTIRTFEADLTKTYDSSYEMSDEEYTRKMDDLTKLENAYLEISQSQEGRMPALPEGRAMFPEQVPTPFGLQVLQTLEDAFNEFENEKIVQHESFEFRKDIEHYAKVLDSLEEKIEDPACYPKLFFNPNDDSKPRGYFEALTPIDKDLMEVRQFMQYKGKGLEYKKYRSLEIQNKRLDRIEGILQEFQQVPNEMINDEAIKYEERLQAAREDLDRDQIALEQRIAEVDEMTRRTSSMIERRKNLERTQRMESSLAPADVFTQPPQFSAEDLQHQLDSLSMALEVNHDFVAKASEDLTDIRNQVDEYEDEVHNKDVDGGRAAEIHDELDEYHEVLNIHLRSLNDKGKETLSHGQSLLEISNEIQKHETLAKINSRDGQDVTHALEPLLNSLGEVRELYNDNQMMLNENQLVATESDGRVFDLKRMLRESFAAPNPPSDQELRDMRRAHRKRYTEPIVKDLSELTPYDQEEDLRDHIARIDATRAYVDPNVADGLTEELEQHLTDSIVELEDLRSFYTKVMNEKTRNADYEPENFVLEQKYQTALAQEEARNTNQYSSVGEIQEADDRVDQKLEELRHVRSALQTIRELRQLRSAYTSMVGPVMRDRQERFGSHFQTTIAREMADVDPQDEEKLAQQLQEIHQCQEFLSAKQNHDNERLHSLGVVPRALHELRPDELSLAQQELEELREFLVKEQEARNAESNLRFMNSRLVLHQRRQRVVEAGFEDSRNLVIKSKEGIAKIDGDQLESETAQNFANKSSLDPEQNLVETIHRIDEEIERQRKDVLPDTFELCQSMLSRRGLNDESRDDLDGLESIDEYTPERKENLKKELEQLRDEYVTYYRRRLSPEKQVELLEQQLTVSKRQKRQLEERGEAFGPSESTEVAGIIQPVPVDDFASSHLVMNQRLVEEQKIAPSVDHDMEEQNRALQRKIAELQQELSRANASPRYTIEEKEHQGGAPRTILRQKKRNSRGPSAIAGEGQDTLTFRPPLSPGKDSLHRRVSSALGSQKERYDLPDIDKTVVKGNFLKKRVYFRIKVPGKDGQTVERRLKHFQQLNNILTMYFNRNGETQGVDVPTVIQAPPTALWKSNMLTQAKIDLRAFLLDCAHNSVIRKHQAYRKFVSDNIDEWKAYTQALAQN